MKNEPFESIEYRGYTINIYRDDDPQNPITDFDMLGTIAYKHPRFILGHEKIDDVGEFFIEKLNQIQNRDNDFWNMESEKVRKYFDKFYCYLPVFAYEHGGITLKTSPFYDSFDSGIIGFIYVLKSKCLGEWKKKRWTKEFENKIKNILKSEIEQFDDYLTGNCWGYEVVDENETFVDSLWGYIGHMKLCIEDAKSLVDFEIKAREQQEWETLSKFQPEAL